MLIKEIFNIVEKNGESIIMLGDIEEFEGIKKGTFAFESILNSFSSEMEDISKSVMKFIDKYSNGVLDSKYVESFDSIFATLRERMKKEESVIFAEYEKISQ